MKQVLLLISGMLVCVLAYAQTPEEDVATGMQLRADGQLEEAFTHFLAAAEHGSPEGMFATAMMYSLGEGVDSNMEEANKWFMKSAYKGFKKAYKPLGEYYLNKKQKDSAVFYLEQIVEWEPSLNGVLGKIYYDRDEMRTALAYFRIGKEKEDPVSMYYLGEMYYDGDFLEYNEREAVKMFQQSAKRGYQPAQEYLEDLGYDDLEEIDAPRSKKEKKKKKQQPKKEIEHDDEEDDNEKYEQMEEPPLTKKQKKQLKKSEENDDEEDDELDEPVQKKKRKSKKQKDIDEEED